MKSGTMITLGIFIFLWLVCSVVSLITYQNIQKLAIDPENKKTAQVSELSEITQKKIALAKKKEEYADLESRAQKISNFIGFRQPSYIGGSSMSDVDSIIFFLDTVCSDVASPIYKNSLKLATLGSENQKIDKEDKIIKGESCNKSQLRNINYVKTLITLEDVWEATIKRIETLQQQAKSKRVNLKDAREEYEKLIFDTQNEITQIQQTLQQKRTEFQENYVKNEEILSNAEEARKKAHEESLQQKELLANVERQQREQNKKFSNEQKILEERVHEIQAATAGQSGVERWFKDQSEKGKAQEIPDGEILYSNNKQQIAYIDLGRSDRIQKGMSFDVIQYGKGGRKEIKGKIEVKEVQEKMSKVSIVKETSILNPIKQGDKIINSVYDKNKIKYFVVAGKITRKYSMDQIRRMVSEIGAQIEDSLTPKTDTIILGEGFERDPIYQSAQERGVETMLEVEFLEHLGVQ